MLEDLIPAELPAGVREVVIQRAEGNPFFVEELVRTLIDLGVLERQNGGWIAHELADELVVPDTVRAVLAARIDLLEPAEKAALQAAAVIGRTFWSGPVYELLDGLEPDLRLLEERDFIRHRSGSSIVGEREFAIKHALTREVAYESLPTMKRARFHARFAAWLERSGDGRDEDAALLAHHYAEAVRPDDVDLAWPDADEELARLRERAVSWLRRAADLAVGRYEIEDGLSLLHRAVELETRRPGAGRYLGDDRARQRSLLRPRRVLDGHAAGNRAGGRRPDYRGSLCGTCLPDDDPSRNVGRPAAGGPRRRLDRADPRAGAARHRGPREGADRPLLLRLRQVVRARTRGERNRRAIG